MIDTGMGRGLVEQLERRTSARVNKVESYSTSMTGPTWKVSTNAGVWFVKQATTVQGAEALRAEAHGIRLLSEPRPENVASLVDHLEAGDGKGGMLILEWIDAGPKQSDYDQRLAGALIDIHTSRGESFGLERDNFIGATSQINTPTDSWVEFFADRRLVQQRRLLTDDGKWRSSWTSGFESILAELGNVLPEHPPPALLHGDLWSGNAMTGGDGRPVLIDPAVYHGHFEADLAMMQLFGGFSGRVFEIYFEQAGRQPAFEERADIYNLYHLLNHVLLFGAGYARRVETTLRRYE